MISSLTIEDVANVLLLADMHSASHLKQKCMQFINNCEEEVMATEAWKMLAKNRIELVLELYQGLVRKR